mgnify:CR=1 FL=1
MNKNQRIIKNIFFYFILINCSCTNSIKKYDSSNLELNEFRRIYYLDINKLTPLKQEWSELYHYITKGHLIFLRKEAIYRYPEYRYALSPEFSKLIFCKIWKV